MREVTVHDGGPKGRNVGDAEKVQGHIHDGREELAAARQEKPRNAEIPADAGVLPPLDPEEVLEGEKDEIARVAGKKKVR